MEFKNWMQEHKEKWDWAQRHNVQITPDGYFILYHGTLAAKQIRKDGFLRKGSYLTTNPEYAQHVADQKSKGDLGWFPRSKPAVFKIKVDPEKIDHGIHVVAKEDIPLQEVP
jgi:hypothetical protein